MLLTCRFLEQELAGVDRSFKFLTSGIKVSVGVAFVNLIAEVAERDNRMVGHRTYQR
jgi:hypothetical protein